MENRIGGLIEIAKWKVWRLISRGGWEDANAVNGWKTTGLVTLSAAHKGYLCGRAIYFFKFPAQGISSLF